MHPYLRFHLLVARNGHPGPPDASTDRPFSSALLRRVLGKALIDRFCPFGKPRCEERPPGALRPPSPQELCHLAAACPYGVLFAASRTARPPYALFVPPLAPLAGDRASTLVEMTLYGPAWRFYPWVLAALRQALDGGVGKARLRWAVQEIRRVAPDRQAAVLAGPELSSLSPTLVPDLLGLALDPYLGLQPVVVDLLSPARLLRHGRLLPAAQAVPFEILIARILDRFAGLYGGEASEILRPEIRSAIEAEAATVPLLIDQTRWVEVQDYSARSASEILLGGKVGRLVYGGDAARFLPILRTGEVLHLGKNTASGCGRIQVDLASPEAA